MTDLKCWSNGADTYIAQSVQQVKEMYVLQNGYDSIEKLDSYQDFDEDEWSVHEDNEQITIWDTADEWRKPLLGYGGGLDIPEDCMIACRAKASEWVKTAHGKPMFLCSTEW